MFQSLRVIVLTTGLAAAAIGVAVPAGAQQAGIAFGGLKQDTTLPVEVQADQLAIDQADGSATFTGNVRVGQGAMRIAAMSVRVEYAQGGGAIARLHATGGVTFTNATDAAEADEAVYTIASGNVVMTGDVLLTQGASAISGERLVIDLTAGTGVMEGRVQTIFRPATAP